MCSKENNDRGCCFCFPSLTGVILLGIWDALVLLSTLWYYISSAEFPETLGLIEMIVYAVAIVSFFLLCISEKPWTRLVLFLIHVVALIWHVVFNVLILRDIHGSKCS